ncbi:MAG: sporulation protein YqfD [Eubacteriales bacterium]|nr:sporulation protein YqfD [Eubacteriales bacterium]
MLFVRLLGFLRGYITVEIIGRSPQRLINICVARGIFLWNIRCVGEGRVQGCMSINAFKNMPSATRKSACRVRVVSRHGLPFLIHRHRRRYVFASGIIALIIICHILSLFVWKIEVTGSEEIDRAVLMDTLSKNGLKVGTLASSVDNNAIRRGVMRDMEELSWVSVMVNGSGAEVEVRKRVPKPDIIEKGKAYNLVASRNGVITSLNISQGVTYVDVGNVVYKGQILVSGVIETTQAGILTVPSFGTVTATTWYEETTPVPDKQEIRTRTGDTKSKHTLEIFGWNIPLFLSDKISFENFDRVSRVNKLWRNSKIDLPFSFHYDKFYDIEINYKKLPLKEGIKIAKNNLKDKITSELGPEAIVNNITYEQWVDQKGKLNLTAVYECSENIGQKKEALYEPYGEDYGSGEDGGDN